MEVQVYIQAFTGILRFLKKMGYLDKCSEVDIIYSISVVLKSLSEGGGP